MAPTRRRADSGAGPNTPPRVCGGAGPKVPPASPRALCFGGGGGRWQPVRRIKAGAFGTVYSGQPVGGDGPGVAIK
eukprot:gene3127-7429_t